MSKIYNHPDFMLLRRIAPHAKSSVLICSDHNCTNNYETNTTKYYHDEHEGKWLMNLSCTICGNKWSICVACIQFKNKLLNDRMISLHRSNHHNKNQEKRSIKNDCNNSNKRIKDCTKTIIEDDTQSDNPNVNDNENKSVIIETETEANILSIQESKESIIPTDHSLNDQNDEIAECIEQTNAMIHKATTQNNIEKIWSLIQTNQ